MILVEEALKVVWLYIHLTSAKTLSQAVPELVRNRQCCVME
jgi:hypothetical protein